MRRGHAVIALGFLAIAVLAGAALLGVLGALVAIPIAGTIQVIAKEMLDARAQRIAQEPRVAADA